MQPCIFESPRCLAFAATLLATCLLASTSSAADPNAAPPAVGDKAKDFELTRLDGQRIKLSKLTDEGPVVLLVLRGYPGYQCPICSRQVGQFLGAAGKLAEKNASVVMIYPGPAEGLQEHAQEFVTGKTLPDNFHLLIDPDYTFTNAYHLRWDAVRETAYPSTFVIDKAGTVLFAKISKTHGDRASVEDVLKAIQP